MEEEKKTKTPTSKANPSSVKKTINKKSSKTTGTKKKTTSKSPAKKSTKASTTKKASATKSTTTKKATTKKSTKSTSTKKKTSSKASTTKKATKKTSTTTKTPAKKTTTKKTTTKKATTKKTTTKKPTTKKTTTKKLQPSVELPKEQPTPPEPKPVEESKPVEKPKEDLIITKQLDINLEDYTYNQEGLVEKVKEILEKEQAENTSLEDSFQDEELFTDIFVDNKNIFNKIRKKIRTTRKKLKASKTKKHPVETREHKYSQIENTQPIKTDQEVLNRETKHKETVLQKQQELERKEKLRKERLARRIFTEEPEPSKPKKKSNLPFLIIAIFVILIICLVSLSYFNNKLDNGSSFSLNPKENELLKQKEREAKQLQEYNDCLNNPLPDEPSSEELNAKINEFNNYIKTNYEASVKYEDLTYGFTYTYNEEPTYYAASTIKLVDALYLYTKASQGEINLDDTMIYSKKYLASSSKYMKTLSYGTKVTIRTLVKYAIEVSDNSAHLMLIDYIGYNNLKEYGKSLGATYTLSGTDKFGYITVNDALIYLKTLNEFINNNEELGRELQSYLLNAEQNDLALPDLNIAAAHKYGEYGSVYHDIGIVYDEHPYAVAILTKEGNSKKFEDKVKDINKHLYELHQAFYTNHEQVCRTKIYGQ